MNFNKNNNTNLDQISSSTQTDTNIRQNYIQNNDNQIKSWRLKIRKLIYGLVVILSLIVGVYLGYQLRKNVVDKQYEINNRNRQIYYPTHQQLSILDPKGDFIIVTCAGRKFYLQILYKYIKKQKHNFYQWHLWINTHDQDDIQYMKKLQRQNSWIKCMKMKKQRNFWQTMVHFYVQDSYTNKVYLKIDDDMVWIDQNFIQTMFNHRFKLEKTFLIFSNIINNAIIDYIHQRLGIFKYPQLVQYHAQGNGWYDPAIGAAIHLQFLQSIQKNQTNKWKSFRQWNALSYQHISINSMIYYSQTVKSIEFIHNIGDEYIYSVLYPTKYKSPSIIVGDAVCVHAAFGIQRQYFATKHPQIEQKYQQIAEKM